MEFLLPVTIDRIRFHPPSRSYAVVVKDMNSELKLPIMIGTYEAQSIAMALEKVKASRPMTHDLLTSLIGEFDSHLVSIHISDLIEGVFYARLVIENNSDGVQRNIDCRPSDAIAIAVRMDAPIKVAKHVMDEVGYLEESEVEMMIDDNPTETESISELEVQLNDAVLQEDYEKAAIIRDRIKELP